MKHSLVALVIFKDTEIDNILDQKPNFGGFLMKSSFTTRFDVSHLKIHIFKVAQQTTYFCLHW